MAHAAFAAAADPVLEQAPALVADLGIDEHRRGAQNDDIPELLSLAKTVSRWESEIVAAVLTGITNSVSESLNRLAKLEARLAHGFRNPANQRRRVRIACTRSKRRRSRQVTTEVAIGNRTATRSRLTSKSRFTCNGICGDREDELVATAITGITTE